MILQAITPDSAAVSSNLLALGDSAIYSKSLAALTILFVVAVLLENAFAVIFNWRVFLTYFSLRGVKTLVMVIVSLVVVNVFDLDVVASLVAAYRNTAAVSGTASRFVTALILAGGSSGVYNIMHALGYRNDRKAQEVAAQPPKTEAWVAVLLERRAAVGIVQVHLKPGGTAQAGGPSPIAGVIGTKIRFRDLFLRSHTRFPPNGGYTVVPNHVYSISVSGKNKDNGAISEAGADFVCGPGAIIDFEMTL